MTAPQSPVIASWLEQLDRVEAEARHLSDSLSEAQFAWRPGAGRWSVGECLDHLAITTGLTLSKIRPALERGRVEGITGTPPFKYGVLGGWFVRAMEKPGKRAMAAPLNFVPPSGIPKSQVLAAFFATQQKLRNSITAAEGLALDRIKAPSSAKNVGWLRLNLAAWFASTLAHERRHLGQARAVVGTPGFPAA